MEYVNRKIADTFPIFMVIAGIVPIPSYIPAKAGYLDESLRVEAFSLT